MTKKIFSAIKTHAQNAFFHFIGLSGWLVLILIIQINRLTYIATPETVSSLHWTEGTVVALWLIAKYEHRVMAFIQKFIDTQTGDSEN